MAALIVVDLQTAMFQCRGADGAGIHADAALVANTRALLARARALRAPVAFIQHCEDEGEFSPVAAPVSWAVAPELGQIPDAEPSFTKTVGDAFSNPALLQWLTTEKNVDRVVLVGAQTDMCVYATTVGGIREGLKVTVVSDAHSTFHDGKRTAEEIINEYNLKYAEAGATVIATAALIAQESNWT
ncbi:Cysteine hydrolase [Entophlyctis luteolus]|nr:Cysteine hydrolase [Entophlyctis luteolus]KAJ3392426.1 Cysteine hydrolase [Entophlyctis sp. JEL0112]